MKVILIFYVFIVLNVRKKGFKYEDPRYAWHVCRSHFLENSNNKIKIREKN